MSRGWRMAEIPDCAKPDYLVRIGMTRRDAQPNRTPNGPLGFLYGSSGLPNLSAERTSWGALRFLIPLPIFRLG